MKHYFLHNKSPNCECLPLTIRQHVKRCFQYNPEDRCQMKYEHMSLVINWNKYSLKRQKKSITETNLPYKVSNIFLNSIFILVLKTS